MLPVLPDFSSYLAERTRDFTGREWVFAEIDCWLATPDASRLFTITGEPGIGKTTIAARMTQIRDVAAYHSASPVRPKSLIHSNSHAPLPKSNIREHR
jgi:hypothetical protein